MNTLECLAEMRAYVWVDVCVHCEGAPIIGQSKSDTIKYPDYMLLLVIHLHLYVPC